MTMASLLDYDHAMVAKRGKSGRADRVLILKKENQGL